MSVALPPALTAKATSSLSRRLGSSSSSGQRPVQFSRRFSSSAATGASGSAAAKPRNVLAFTSPQHFAKTVGRTKKPQAAQRLLIHPFFAPKSPPQSLVKHVGRHQKESPVLIRDLPEFLGNQAWIDHAAGHEASFKTPQKHQIKEPAAGFDLLNLIFESAATGRSRRDLTSAESAIQKAVFDDIEAECKIRRSSLEGDEPPLVKFHNWLAQSEFKDFSLNKTVARIREAYINNTRRPDELWVDFRAPLAFIRALHQYNQDQIMAANRLPPSEFQLIRDEKNPACITRANGLVVLTGEMTKHFPFPRIVQDIGSYTYQVKTCNIRIGIRPPRVDLRRSSKHTTVIGQLAGAQTTVILVPPRLNMLKGLSLEFHKKVLPSWEHLRERFPQGPPNLAIKNSIFTSNFQARLTQSGDVCYATLKPGSALIVPSGWYYAVRGDSQGLELTATVTWFLEHSAKLVEEQEDQEKDPFVEKFPPWVSI
ncbi:hypothetical protein F5Y14DRAFT_429256 [Nemania sp. NC0429]|nr:hypothetical protein F5Y14DRAFT_429256 [Nemania sp. NC0429]